MGLAEKRGIKQFQENHFETLRQTVTEAAGFDVELEVVWEQLAADDYAHLYDEAWKKVYFDSVAEALSDITRDDMGKEALAESLKKVVFCNTADNYSPHSAIKFDEGVLTVDHSPISNVDDIKSRKEFIVQTLEKAM